MTYCDPLKDALFRVMLWVVGATDLGLGLEHSAQNVALVLPHLLQLLRRVLLKGHWASLCQARACR